MRTEKVLPDTEQMVIDNPIPAGANWFEVIDPYGDFVASPIGPKTKRLTPAQTNAKRREVRQAQKVSPYLQVSLQHDKRYTHAMQSILKKS